MIPGKRVRRFDLTCAVDMAEGAAALEKLYARYAAAWEETKQHQAALDRGARIGAGWVQRPEKFRASAGSFLLRLPAKQMCVSPDPPVPRGRFGTFDDLVSTLLKDLPAVEARISPRSNANA